MSGRTADEHGITQEPAGVGEPENRGAQGNGTTQEPAGAGEPENRDQPARGSFERDCSDSEHCAAVDQLARDVRLSVAPITVRRSC